MLSIAFKKQKTTSNQKPEDFFERVRGSYAFLMESLSGEGRRYSYIGYDPFAVVTSRDGINTVLTRRKPFSLRRREVDSPRQSPREGVVVNRVKLYQLKAAPLESLRGLIEQYQIAGKKPVPFAGGAAGFFSYDFGARLMGLRQRVVDDVQLPDLIFCFVDKIIAFDHSAGIIYFIGLGLNHDDACRKAGRIWKNFLQPGQNATYLHGVSGMSRKERLAAGSQPPLTAFSSKKKPGTIGIPKSNLNFAQYKRKISSIKKLLYEGETYQVNFSQRFSARCRLDPWTIYKHFGSINPAPFSCYFEFPDFQIVSASPELLLRKQGRFVETWPIKGTVARGRNTKEIATQVRKLLASEKDKAELAMIVDLERNDLGRVCEPGSVKVYSEREIQRLTYVIHTFSRVQGNLSRGKDFFDLFEALFPGGSITGCPKRRTMEIIDKLEDYKRGVYTGSAGFIGFDGDAEMNILIRTMLMKNGKIYFQAGGGIVVDSDAKKEYQETLDKARGLFESLG